MVEDESGNARSITKATPDGGVQTIFLDANGAIRTSIGVLSTGEPAFGMYDGNGQTKLAISLLGGGAQAHFYDCNKHVAMSLACTEGKNGAFVLADSFGNPRLALSMTPDGQPEVSLMGTEGEERISITLGSDGEPSITGVDEDGVRQPYARIFNNGFGMGDTREENGSVENEDG